MFSDSLKLQLYQHRGQLNLLKVEVYLKPPHLNVALWEIDRSGNGNLRDLFKMYRIERASFSKLKYDFPALLPKV